MRGVTQSLQREAAHCIRFVFGCISIPAGTQDDDGTRFLTRVLQGVAIKRRRARFKRGGKLTPGEWQAHAREEGHA